MKTCRWCQCDITIKHQLCIEPSVDWCEADIIWIGYEFRTDADERHRFAQELRAAHVAVVEVGPYVLCDSEDVVLADSVRRATFGEFESQVVSFAARYSDHQLQQLETKWKDRNAPQS